MKITDEFNYENYFSEIEKKELDELIKFSKTVKVLLVDSDEETISDIKSIFKIFFHEIDLATDGKEGLEFFKNNRYDLIITSLDMPNMNGLEMIEKIREISRHISILVLSLEEKYFIDLIKLNVDGYILRPVEVKQFVSIIQKVIEKLIDRQIIYEYRLDLENRVKAKTKELEELNKNLEKRVKEELEKNKEKDEYIFNHMKLTSMSEMINNISHQWRQPLSYISTSASGIQVQNKLLPLSQDELDERMENIVEKVNSLSKTLDIFNTLIEKDKQKENISIQEVILNSIDIFQESLDNYKIVLKTNIDLSKDVKVNLIVSEFTQALINIISNSIDVLLLKKIENPYIEINLENLDDKVLISIEDNGGGISDDIKPRIYEPYFTTKHQSNDIGLGLHMSYKIVTESLDGKLYEKNTQNGARFFIEIPLT